MEEHIDSQQLHCQCLQQGVYHCKYLYISHVLAYAMIPGSHFHFCTVMVSTELPGSANAVEFHIKDDMSASL